jgi:cobalt-zinc-cadmium efflux system protein
MHDHGHKGQDRHRNRRRLGAALLLAAGYMGVEVVGGLWTGSLALLADAGHMLSDVAALALALFASWIASQPSGARWTYGLARAEILAALVQGALLVAVAILVVLEAVERLGQPTPILGPGMLLVATGGIVVNLAGLAVLESGRHESLNVRGAWLHVLSDTLGSLGAVVAGFLVWRFDWLWADPAASLGISALVLFSAWHLLREAVDVLMEAAPRHLDPGEIETALMELPDVVRVHDLHVWTIGSGEISLSCHVVAKEYAAGTELLALAYRVLGQRFGIDHATLQVEPEDFEHETPRSVCDPAG